MLNKFKRFLCLHLQIYPEIDPEFIEEHLKKLEKKWHVINTNGISRDLIFNQDFEYPLIYQGWSEFKDVNNLPNDVEVILTCYGPNLFTINSYKMLINREEIPTFSSKCLKPLETIFFDIPLTEENFATSDLVQLLTFLVN
jgi:hypothetical protein